MVGKLITICARNIRACENYLAAGILNRYAQKTEFMFQGTSLTFLKPKEQTESGQNIKNTVIATYQLLLQQIYYKSQGNSLYTKKEYIRILSRRIEQNIKKISQSQPTAYTILSTLYQQVQNNSNSSKIKRIEALLSHVVNEGDELSSNVWDEKEDSFHSLIKKITKKLIVDQKIQGNQSLIQEAILETVWSNTDIQNEQLLWFLQENQLVTCEGQEIKVLEKLESYIKSSRPLQMRQILEVIFSEADSLEVMEHISKEKLEQAAFLIWQEEWVNKILGKLLQRIELIYDRKTEEEEIYGRKNKALGSVDRQIDFRSLVQENSELENQILAEYFHITIKEDQKDISFEILQEYLITALHSMSGLEIRECVIGLQQTQRDKEAIFSIYQLLIKKLILQYRYLNKLWREQTFSIEQLTDSRIQYNLAYLEDILPYWAKIFSKLDRKIDFIHSEEDYQSIEKLLLGHLTKLLTKEMINIDTRTILFDALYALQRNTKNVSDMIDIEQGEWKGVLFSNKKSVLEWLTQNQSLEREAFYWYLREKGYVQENIGIGMTLNESMTLWEEEVLEDVWEKLKKETEVWHRYRTLKKEEMDWDYEKSVASLEQKNEWKTKQELIFSILENLNDEEIEEFIDYLEDRKKLVWKREPSAREELKQWLYSMNSSQFEDFLKQIEEVQRLVLEDKTINLDNKTIQRQDQDKEIVENYRLEAETEKNTEYFQEKKQRQIRIIQKIWNQINKNGQQEKKELEWTQEELFLEIVQRLDQRLTERRHQEYAEAMDAKAIFFTILSENTPLENQLLIQMLEENQLFYHKEEKSDIQEELKEYLSNLSEKEVYHIIQSLKAIPIKMQGIFKTQESIEEWNSLENLTKHYLQICERQIYHSSEAEKSDENIESTRENLTLLVSEAEAEELEAFSYYLKQYLGLELEAQRQDETREDKLQNKKKELLQILRRADKSVFYKVSEALQETYIAIQIQKNIQEKQETIHIIRSYFKKFEEFLPQDLIDSEHLLEKQRDTLLNILEESREESCESFYEYLKNIPLLFFGDRQQLTPPQITLTSKEYPIQLLKIPEALLVSNKRQKGYQGDIKGLNQISVDRQALQQNEYLFEQLQKQEQITEMEHLKQRDFIFQNREQSTNQIKNQNKKEDVLTKIQLLEEDKIQEIDRNLKADAVKNKKTLHFNLKKQEKDEAVTGSVRNKTEHMNTQSTVIYINWEEWNVLKNIWEHVKIPKKIEKTQESQEEVFLIEQKQKLIMAVKQLNNRETELLYHYLKYNHFIYEKDAIKNLEAEEKSEKQKELLLDITKAYSNEILSNLKGLYEKYKKNQEQYFRLLEIRQEKAFADKDNKYSSQALYKSMIKTEEGRTYSKKQEKDTILEQTAFINRKNYWKSQDREQREKIQDEKLAVMEELAWYVRNTSSIENKNNEPFVTESLNGHTEQRNIYLPAVDLFYKKEKNTIQKVKVEEQIEEAIHKAIVKQKIETLPQIQAQADFYQQSVDTQKNNMEWVKKEFKKQEAQLETLKKETKKQLSPDSLYQIIMKRMESQLRLERLRRGLE